MYEQIVSYYEKLIVTGVLPEDTQMPSVRQMAAELSVNPNTIQKAYGMLESSGYIYPVKGKGSFVANNTVLAEAKRREWLEGLKTKLQEGRELGVSAEQCRALTDEIFGRDEI